MALGQILFRTHLFQPADRAFELEAAIAGFIEFGGLRIGCGEQLDLVFVERIDQLDDVRDLVALAVPNVVLPDVVARTL